MNFGSCVSWIDHGVDGATLCGDVGVEQPFLVGRFEFESLVGCVAAVKDLDGALLRPSRQSRPRARPGRDRCPSAWSP